MFSGGSLFGSVRLRSVHGALSAAPLSKVAQENGTVPVPSPVPSSVPENCRYRPKGVLGKGGGKKKNAPEMRQKCVIGSCQDSCVIEKRGTFQNVSKIRPKCVKNAQNTFGGEHLLDDTEIAPTISVLEIRREVLTRSAQTGSE